MTPILCPGLEPYPLVSNAFYRSYQLPLTASIKHKHSEECIPILTDPHRVLQSSIT
jgi:hypothetical protein